MPTSAGKPTADGKRVYRLTAPQVTWWAWAVVALLSVGDLVIQGHDLSALRFAFGLMAVTGLVFACTLWPKVIADEDGMSVQNPFRCFDIPWGAVKGVMVGDSVQVLCARTPPKKDKTIYSWALASPRRANARAEMRARRWDRDAGRVPSRPSLLAGLSGSHGVPAGWDRMPEAAKEIAKLPQAEFIARELASIAREAQSGSGIGAGPGTEIPVQSQAGAGSNGAESGASTATAVVSGRWAWPPLAALFFPVIALGIALLIS